MEAPLVFVCMGVMGCGKSTVAALLAAKLGCGCYEGDAFHPPANIEKMRVGIPLTDDDRWPWLEQLAAIIQRHLAAGQPAVLACSALKPAHRQLLRTGRRDGVDDTNREGGGSGSSSGSADARRRKSSGGDADRVAFVLLDPPHHLLQQRLEQRTASGDHFTPGTALLASQLAALEYGEEELLLHVRGDPFPPPADVVAAVLARLGR